MKNTQMHFLFTSLKALWDLWIQAFNLKGAAFSPIQQESSRLFSGVPTMKLLRVRLSARQKPVDAQRWSDIWCFAIVTAIVRLYMWFYELACVCYKTFNSSQFKSGFRDWKATEENLF